MLELGGSVVGVGVGSINGRLALSFSLETCCLETPARAILHIGSGLQPSLGVQNTKNVHTTVRRDFRPCFNTKTSLSLGYMVVASTTSRGSILLRVPGRA